MRLAARSVIVCLPRTFRGQPNDEMIQSSISAGDRVGQPRGCGAEASRQCTLQSTRKPEFFYIMVAIVMSTSQMRFAPHRRRHHARSALSGLERRLTQTPCLVTTAPRAYTPPSSPSPARSPVQSPPIAFSIHRRRR